MQAKNQHFILQKTKFMSTQTQVQKKQIDASKTERNKNKPNQNMQILFQKASNQTQIQRMENKQNVKKILKKYCDGTFQPLQCPYCNQKLALVKQNTSIYQDNNSFSDFMSLKIMQQQLNAIRAKNLELINYITRLQLFIRELQLSRIQISLKSIQQQQVQLQCKDQKIKGQICQKLIQLNQNKDSLITRNTKQTKRKQKQKESIGSIYKNKQNKLQKKKYNQIQKINKNGLQGIYNQSVNKKKRFNRTSADKISNSYQKPKINEDQAKQYIIKKEQTLINNKKESNESIKIQKTSDDVQKQREIQVLSLQFMDFMTQFQKERHKSKRKIIVKKIAEIAKKLDFLRNNQQFMT